MSPSVRAVRPPEEATDAERWAMRRAIRLTADPPRRTSPNPYVGCVVLDADARFAGEGYHRGAGHPHAEVEALAAAGERARGGTAVVTLEPCAHRGRTGPCTEALWAAGVSRVVFAVEDPTRDASGGAERLAAGGVEVVGGLHREEAERHNEFWLTSVRRERPFVTWKFAGTIDGRSAAADGSSRWITAAQARRDAHALRAVHDAVLVGGGTLRADDPHLGLRHGVAGEPPLRVVLDSAGRIEPGARVLDGSAPTLVVVSDRAGEPRELGAGASTLAVPSTEDGLDLAALSGRLFARGVRSVLLEGGARLAAGFLAGGLVDRVVAYLAPMFLGGAGLPVVTGIGVASMAEAARMRVEEVRQLGPDLRVVMRPEPHDHNARLRTRSA
ncbi:bifunctional diaminohydroxyphosphoribosylaminopyrimidine deaminase/5-amino-6-(5-phosphoribosylamino)uracil reductase RibD [Saccharopolyspora erythraea]|uniref:bifunctional diaminohydroxyphosphoribosylaminopyrimidine deaminase/5-amino-6-(5-phosphoribosylamino)uracil reductase RibD n=1 Tax=Saccharopolyspora erythraea TaxID=1836 RepID=UPI001BAE12D9|nr:bifunctional diaminohydroxyphosphoribosylaminopyrimidine deaminase/5-amino-6-(5-phosphoribosylamino)uracil reductase RibD [Saccharopolyspora erythraea]